MTTSRELSNQTELVFQLDPEPVFDYLLLHRTLDQSTVDQIRQEEKLADRNIKLLKHLEELGNTAIELFINALRQSGQLHLASSLDIENRIKPVLGKGYWEKQRYKGQIAISFQLVAAKLMVRKDSDEDKSPRIMDLNAMLTPFKVIHSYENMTLIDSDENGPNGHKILEYSYSEDDEDKSCCWCCIPFLCCSSRSRKKKRKQSESHINEVNVPFKNGAETAKSASYASLTICDVMVSLPSQPSSPIKSGSTFFKTRKMSPLIENSSTEQVSTDRKANSDRNSNHRLNEVLLSNYLDGGKDVVEMRYVANSEKMIVVDKNVSKDAKTKKNNNGKINFTKSASFVEISNHKNGKILNEVVTSVENKENTEPSIWNVQENGCENVKDHTQKLSPPTSLNTQNCRTGMTRSDTYELVERWKSEGGAYQSARDQFFSLFDANTRSKIVRYFEQNRSTLVLQISTDEKMAVCIICMTTKEVRKLREDYEMGVLHEDLVRCVDPQSIVDKMECCAVHLRTVIDDNDFALSYQELS